MAQDRLLWASIVAGMAVGIELIAIMGGISIPPAKPPCTPNIEVYLKSPAPVKVPNYLPDGYDLTCAEFGVNVTPEGGDPGYTLVFSRNSSWNLDKSAILLEGVNETGNPYNFPCCDHNFTKLMLVLNGTSTTYSPYSNHTITTHVIMLSNRLTTTVEGYEEYPSSVSFYEGKIYYHLESRTVPVRELEKMASSMS